jgi:hypothetical protein
MFNTQNRDTDPNDVFSPKASGRGYNRALLLEGNGSAGMEYAGLAANDLGTFTLNNEIASRARAISDNEYEAIKKHTASSSYNEIVYLDNGYKKPLNYHLPIQSNGETNKGRFKKAFSNSLVTPSLGTVKAIDTLTYVKQTTVQQKFYTVDIAKYVPIQVGEAGFMNQIIEYTEYNTADMTDDVNFVGVGTSPKRKSTIEIGLGAIYVPTAFFINELDYNIKDVQEMAAGRVPMSLIQMKERALKRKFDLAHQNVIMNNGLYGSNQYLGLGNLYNTTTGSVTVDTTSLTIPISQLNSSQYETFVGNTIQQYNNNTNGTAMPTTFTIPQSDYINLGGVHVSPTNPFNRKLDDLLGAFKKQTGDENFQILPNKYFEANFNADAKNKYLLYRNDPDTLQAHVPVPYTSTAFNTMNGFEFYSVSYAQICGLVVKRPAEIYYYTF